MRDDSTQSGVVWCGVVALLVCVTGTVLLWGGVGAERILDTVPGRDSLSINRRAGTRCGEGGSRCGLLSLNVKSLQYFLYQIIVAEVHTIRCCSFVR
jgi:hypothetical protein